MADVAKITVKAFHAKTGKPIMDVLGVQCMWEVECSTDVPADALGEATTLCMQKAWHTGVDGTEIELRVTFS